MTFPIRKGRSSLFRVVRGPVKARDVEKLNLFIFYELGANVRRLKLLRTDMTLGQAYPLLNEARDSVFLFDLLQPVRLTTCRSLIDQLSTVLHSIINDQYMDGNSPPSFRSNIDFQKEQLDWQAVWSLHTLIDKFENVISAEFPQIPVYHPVKVGAYDVNALVDKAEANIPEELTGFMDERAAKDYNAAGRCLAFGLPTASGFHITRAVEAVLQQYYRAYLKDAAKDNPERWTWFDYVDALEKFADTAIVTPKPKDTTLGHLDQLRALERNKVIHPRADLDATTAFVLFNNCTNAIIAMAQEMKILAEGGQQIEFKGVEVPAK